MQGSMKMSGGLRVRVRRAERAPLSWRLRNTLRPQYLWGWLCRQAAFLFTVVTGIPALLGRLEARLVKADGRVINYGTLGFRLVTTAFVNDLVDELQSADEIADYDFHDSGVGTTPAAVGDTDIETTDNESRATGTPGENGANVYQNVGTITYSSSLAITEHGLFCNATGATLMDRHVFSAINVANGDSIQFTYELTVTAGG